jgi:hypothetical protein
MTYCVGVHLSARQLTFHHIYPKKCVSTIPEQHTEMRERILENRLYRDHSHSFAGMTGILLVHKPLDQTC